jgi:cyclophilin family peptidyl-prolyl cis-trans isomerase
MITLGFLFGLLLQAPASGQSVQAPPANPIVTIDTSMGAITIELFPDKAPVSVENFLEYVRDNFYAGTIFHRIVPGLVVQGGGFTADLVEKPTRPPIQNEATNGLRNQRGTVAMARTRVLRSATSQFYINLSDNARFDHTGYAPDDFGYAVFGRVVSGMDIVDQMGKVPTESKGPMDDVPVTPIVIKGMTVKR